MTSDDMWDSFLGKEVLIAENDQYQLYSDSLTRDCTKKARAMDIHGMELRGWSVYKAVPKDGGNRFFVIFDENGTPYKDTDSIWEMYDWIKVIKLNMSYDYNIVDMAERLKEEKE